MCSLTTLLIHGVWQVVLSKSGAEKKDGKDLQACAKSLQDMGSALQDARKKASSDATVAADLECSQLHTVDEWLVSVANTFLTCEQEVLKLGFARVATTSQELAGTLQKLPPSKDEVAFREAGVKLVQKLAAASAKLGQDCSVLEANLASVEAVLSIRFSDHAPDSQLCQEYGLKAKSANKEKLEEASQQAARAAAVVALVANLCLLRSPSLEAASPSRADLAKLADIVSTAQNHLGKLPSPQEKLAIPLDDALRFLGGKVLAESQALLDQQKLGKGQKRKAEAKAEATKDAATTESVEEDEGAQSAGDEEEEEEDDDDEAAASEAKLKQCIEKKRDKDKSKDKKEKSKGGANKAAKEKEKAKKEKKEAKNAKPSSSAKKQPNFLEQMAAKKGRGKEKPAPSKPVGRKK